MLRILESEHIRHLLHAQIRSEQSVFGYFHNLKMDILPRRLPGLRLHQITEIIGRKAYLVGKILHRWQSFLTGYPRVPIFVQ